MDGEISKIGGQALILMWGFGPVAVLMASIALLNRRDRRRERLLSFVARQFSGEVLRSYIVIDARCSLLTTHAVVRVDIRLDGGEVWPSIERLRQTLPPMVDLAVRGASHTVPRGNARSDAAAAEPRAALAFRARLADREVRVES